MQAVGQRGQRRTQDLRGAKKLKRDAAQFFEDRRGAIGLVVLLIADRGHPDKSALGQTLQLALHRARAGSGAVQRELQRLAESGLVRVTTVGNQKHYQANRAAPIFEELRGIALKLFGATEVLRAALAPLADRLHVAWLYGSVAKRSDRAQSDIDVLIVSDDLTLEEVYVTLADAEKKLGRGISPTLYTLKEYQHRLTGKNPFLTKVMAGEHVLLIGSADAVGPAR